MKTTLRVMHRMEPVDPGQSLDDERARLTRGQVAILDSIWAYNREHSYSDWPTTRSIHLQFGPKAVAKAIAGLPDGAVLETSGGNATRYALRLLGILLTSNGPECELLIVRYLEFVRNLARAAPHIENVLGSTVATALKLSPAQDALLGRVVGISQFLWSSGYGPGPPWQAGVPKDLERFPEIDDFTVYLRETALEEGTRIVRQHAPFSRLGGRGSTGGSPLWFVRNDELRAVLESDYRELEQLDPRATPKCCIVLCGGLLEGMLLDALEQRRDEALEFRTQRGDKQLPALDRWSFEQLVDTAAGLGLLSKGSKSLGHAVREYRNLVHAAAQVREGISVSPRQATTTREALKVFMEELEAAVRGE